ncbi:DciA family protein [Streptomyces sp. NPDC094147]
MVNRARSSRREGGRDPYALGTVVAAVVAERAWDTALPENTVLDQWPVSAPELARHVAAVCFAIDEGRLDLLPDSQAYAVQVRLTADRLVERINTELGRAAIRRIRVLVPGSADAAGPAEAADNRDDAPTGPEPSAGYRRALAALRSSKAGRSGGPTTPVVRVGQIRE